MNVTEWVSLALRTLIIGLITASLVPNARAQWDEQILYSFQDLPDGSVPTGGVVFDAAGNLYGATTDGGSSSCRGPFQCGTVYQLKPPMKGDPWTERVLYVFKGSGSKDGASPFGGLTIDAEGNLYGTTGYDGTGNCILLGGNVGCGTVYELSLPAQKGGPWIETVLYNFKGDTDGQLPIGDLVFDKQGNLYGVTQYGGGYGSCNSLYLYCGAVFELSPPKKKGGKWTEKVLHGFKGGSDGASPSGGLVLDSGGNVYGTTYEGGACAPPGCGTIFKLSPPVPPARSWTEELYRFKGYPSDGSGPNGGLVLRANGKLYGTTGGGGSHGQGLVLEVQPPSGQGDTWVVHQIFVFNGADGGNPGAGLTPGTKGDFYGTDSGGPPFFGGLVFHLKPPTGSRKNWTIGSLYEFKGRPDGEGPHEIILGSGQSIYGTTSYGGTGSCTVNGCGTVFEVSLP